MLKDRILLTLRFFDLQDYPLTLLELHQFLLADAQTLKNTLNTDFEVMDPAKAPLPPAGVTDVLLALETKCETEVVNSFGYYHLTGRENIAQARSENYLNGIAREKLIRKYVRFLRYLPFVRGVALGGSQAMGQQKKESDMDLLIFIQPDFMWIGRIFVSVFFQIFGVRRHGQRIANRFCLNHYLTKTVLVRHGKDLYNAMEYMRLRPCVFGQTVVEFQKSNSGWIRQCFPNFQSENLPTEKPSRIQVITEKIFTNKFGKILEGFLGKWQLKRINRGNPVVASWQEISFHSVERKKNLLGKFLSNPF